MIKNQNILKTVLLPLIPVFIFSGCLSFEGTGIGSYLNSAFGSDSPENINNTNGHGVNQEDFSQEINIDYDNNDESPGNTVTITGLEILKTYMQQYRGEYRVNAFLFLSNTRINMEFPLIYGSQNTERDFVTIGLRENTGITWTGSGKYYVVISIARYDESPFAYFITTEAVDFAAKPTLEFSKLKYFNPDGEWKTPNNAVALAENIWISDRFNNTWTEKWYSFNAKKGAEYEVFIDDKDWNNSKADVLVDIYLNEVRMRYRLDIYNSVTGKFTAFDAGVVYVKVYMLASTEGSFNIAYNTTGVRPLLR